MNVFSENKRDRSIHSMKQEPGRALRRLLFFLPSFFIGILPIPLFADCQVELATGMHVTCTGNDADGVETGGQNDTITVATGAQVGKSDHETAAITTTAHAVTINSHGGNDQIANNGSVTATVTILVDPPNQDPAWLGNSVPSDGFAATATATGIDSGTSTIKDSITNNGTVDIDAEATVNAGTIQLDLIDGTSANASLSAQATAIGLTGTNSTTITNNGTLTVYSNASILAWTGEVNAADWATATTTVTPMATALGIAGGKGYDTITNTGIITATAEADAVVPIGEFNVVDLAVLGAGIGTEEHPMLSRATGIEAGDGGSQMTNTATGQITARAESTANIDSVNLSLYDFTIAADYRDNAGSIATEISAIATGIDAGSGKDQVTNNGTITVSAITSTVGTSLGVGAEGVPSGLISDFFANFYVPADASIRAFSGTVDSEEAQGRWGAVGIQSGGGNDTIINTGAIDIDAQSTAVSAGLSVSFPLLELTGLGKWWNDFPPAIAIAASGASAEANAVGVAAGDGNDTITNGETAGAFIDVTATTLATADQASIVLQNVKTEGGGAPYFLNLDVGLANATTLAASQATGLDGGSGNDRITNSTPLIVLADADAYGSAASVAVEGLKGMTGVGIAFVETKLDTRATATATGIAGGGGADDVYNTSGPTTTADALAHSLAAVVSVQGEMKGIGAGVAFANSDTISTANAVGLTGGDGADFVLNSGTGTKSLTTYATSEAYAESFAVTVQASSTGLELGGALATGATTARSTGHGIDGGAGNDQLVNSGMINVDAEATTNNLAVAVDIQAAVKGLGVGVAFTDASSTGTATAEGLIGGAGKDTLRNDASGTINVHADAEAYAELFSVGVQATSSGVALGGALALADSRATATATGMDGGASRDRLINAGMTEVNAESTANSLAVSATIQAEVVGVGAQAAFTESSTFSTATALGLAGGVDRDTLINQAGGTIRADATAKAYAESISVSIQGDTAGVALAGALARAETTPIASSTGFAGDEGNDVLFNYGLTDVSAVTDSTSVAVSARLVGLVKGVSVGASLTDTSTTATALALGMDGGTGDDTIFNGGTIKADTDSTLRAASVSFDYGGFPLGVSAGAALAKADTTATGYATGINGGLGDDTIANAAGALIDVETTANSTSTAVAISANVLGAAWTDTSTTTHIQTVGIDGGEGSNWVTNSGRIMADANATGNASSYAITIGAGGSSAKTGTVATASVFGLLAGGGADTFDNDGTISLLAQSTLNAESVSFTLSGFSAAQAASTATSNATGIDAGEGANIVINRAGGVIAAKALATAKAENVAVTIGVAGVDGSTKATAQVAGIKTGEDVDTIYNYGAIEAGSKVSTTTVGGTLNLAGIAALDSTPGALVEGITSGGGDDYIFNTGTITLSGLTTNPVTGEWTVGGTGASPLAYAEIGTVGFLSLINFSGAQFTAKAQATGINGGSGDDTIINRGIISVGGTDWMAEGVAAGFTFHAISLFDITNVGARAETVSLGIEGGDGADTITNAASGRLTVRATSHADALGSVETLFFGSTAAFATSTTRAEATGIGGGKEADVINNEGVIDAMSNTWADGDAEVWVGWGTPAAYATARATAWTAGVDAGEGRDTVTNNGQIEASAYSRATANATADSDVASNESEAEADSQATAFGIRAGEDGGDTVNGSGHTVTVEATAAGHSTSTSDESADALAVFTAAAIGIHGGSGNSVTQNLGGITVTSTTATSDPLYWDAHAIGSSNTGTARATAKRGGSATATGISMGHGNNWIGNEGTLTVTATTTGKALADYPDAHLDYAYSYAGAGTVTLLSHATGIAVGNGDNTLISTGAIDITSTLTATATSSSNTTRDTNYAQAYAGGTAQSTGVSTGNGRNTISLWDAMTVTAAATATANGYGEDYGYGYVGDESTAGVTARTRGIFVGSGDNTITVGDVLDVSATASAIALGSAHTYSDDPHGTAVAHSQADAAGILAGDGNNTLTIDGTIRVSAIASAKASVDVDSTWGDEYRSLFQKAEDRAVGVQMGLGDNRIVISAHGTLDIDAFASCLITGSCDVDATAYGIVAGSGDNAIANHGVIDVSARTQQLTSAGTAARESVGILTGNGNDVISNFGTIRTAETGTTPAAMIAAAGIAVDTGGGNDWLILGAGSTTIGDILLGEGDDTLAFLGSAAIDGVIDPGSGSNSLVFDGFGKLEYTFIGFENATKLGAGTYTLASLPTMQWLDIAQGTLQLESSYAMAGDSLFRTVINSDGSHGRLSVEGEASLDGALRVSRGPGYYFNGTTYDILTAAEVQGAFTSVILPASTKLLSFELHQRSESVQIETLVKSFTVAAIDPISMAVAEYLDRIQYSVSGDLLDILTGIQNFEDSGFDAAFHSLSPSSYDHSTTASIIGARQNMQSVQQRMSSVRTYSLAAGPTRKNEPILLASIGLYNFNQLVATGQEPASQETNNLWMSAVGFRGDQDEKDGFPGYDVSIATGTIGYDYTFPSRVTLGAAVSKGSIDVDLANDTGSGSIETVSAIVYGSFSTSAAYVEGAVSYGQNGYESNRPWPSDPFGARR